MLKDCTDQYAIGVQQHNLFHILLGKKIGNTSYPKEMIGSETYPSISQNKDEDYVKIWSSINTYRIRATAMTGTARLRHSYNVVTYLFSENYTTGKSMKDVEESSISGFRMYNKFKKPTLDNEKKLPAVFGSRSKIQILP